MIFSNKNFERLGENYLFSEVRKRKNLYQNHHSDAYLINLGVGDVLGPLSPVVIEGLHTAVDEYAQTTTFKGYPPETGYPFLKNKIIESYVKNNVDLTNDFEIFIGDGAKSDLGNILDIFNSLTSLIPTPVYPVYEDSNIIAGNKIKYLPCKKETNFIPRPNWKDKGSYLIYLCSPNNPTGVVIDFNVLTEWVEYANKTNSVIIFDSAYSAYVTGNYPKSIFEIQGADKCSIEISSFSKSFAFTGLRLGYTIIPKQLKRGEFLYRLWFRRQSTKFNGVSYLVQRAGECALTNRGIEESKKQIELYLSNAKTLKMFLLLLGYEVYGGDNSPYLWLNCKTDSWSFFDEMLNKYQIIGTPGVGFGKGGEGYFRLSSFATDKDIDLAVERLSR